MNYLTSMHSTHHNIWVDIISLGLGHFKLSACKSCSMINKVQRLLSAITYRL